MKGFHNCRACITEARCAELNRCLEASSAQAPVENREASQLVGSGASGSVSAYDALCLAVSWEKAAHEREKLATEARRAGNIDEALPLENSAAAYMRCARELTKLTGYPNMRQPTQNVPDEPQARSKPKTNPLNP